MSITKRYPTLPGNITPNVTRYPPYRGNGNGNADGDVERQKRYPRPMSRRALAREEKLRQIREVRDALRVMLPGDRRP